MLWKSWGKKPVEVVKGRILAGRAQKSPEHWCQFQPMFEENQHLVRDELVEYEK